MWLKGLRFDSGLPTFLLKALDNLPTPLVPRTSCSLFTVQHSTFFTSGKKYMLLGEQGLSRLEAKHCMVLIIDSGLTLATRISFVARNCFYQLRRIRQAKKCLDKGSVKTLVHALVLSRLDYCNSILANLPDVTLAPLVRVQHSAARLIRNPTKQDSVLPVMMELHWLPLRFRITFKLCVDAWRPLRLGT